MSPQERPGPAFIALRAATLGIDDVSRQALREWMFKGLDRNGNEVPDNPAPSEPATIAIVAGVLTLERLRPLCASLYCNASLDDRCGWCYCSIMGCKMIAYYRVSTKRQGTSGLGLEGQETAVAAHVATADCELIASYTEIETGKKHDLVNRPELAKAVAHAKRSKAILVVAKLDRLLRSTVVLAMLKTTGVNFIACDNPNANEFTIDILAAVAANEAREISKRTKAALAALKARGTSLGGARPGHPKPTREMALKGASASAKARSAAAFESYSDLIPVVRDLRDRGLSLRKIAAELNATGHATRSGQSWNPMQTSRVLALARH